MPDRMIRMAKGDQVFRWTDKAGKDTFFPVDPIIDWCWRGYLGALVPLDFRPDIANYREHLRHANDVQVDKALALPEAALQVPPVMILLREGTAIPMDGAHRLWRMLGEQLEGKRARVYGWVVHILELEATGLAWDEPVPIRFNEGYDRDEHIRRTRESYARHIAAGGQAAP